MSRKFKELHDTLSPEAQQRVADRAALTLKEIDWRDRVRDGRHLMQPRHTDPRFAANNVLT